MSPHLRNGPYGYGLVTKTLHWLLVAAFTAQFAVGYLLDGEESGHGRGRGRGRGGESGHGRGQGRGGGYEVFGDDSLLTLHVALGATILALGLVRLLWRLTTPLPPWAPTLTAVERRLATWTERALHFLTFAVPLSGLWLIAADDDALPWHIAGHVAFFAVLALHVGLALKHQLLDRDHLLLRMLWGRTTP
ncbi:cytochrome b/b6 domain-containing protein [Streptomyces sp. NPDC002896]|uniref:cytochrome b n=1 Tax=Streptomyces sp. NPDC002896 TaxID=3154438 RepID=UPI003327C553